MQSGGKCQGLLSWHSSSSKGSGFSLMGSQSRRGNEASRKVRPQTEHILRTWEKVGSYFQSHATCRGLLPLCPVP